MSHGRTCEFDVTPEAALAALHIHQGPTLIDLDETLYLRNSTEDFIDCAQPTFLVAILLRILDALKPWRLTGPDTQDNWRASIVWHLFPWTRWRWRTRVQSLAERHTNTELSTALNARRDLPVVVTVGFRPIVTPLLAAMGYAHVPLVAARIHSFADRRNGKLHMAVSELGRDAVAQSLVVTDSVADLDLLRACHMPLRTRWPQAIYERALSDTYFPGEYISRVKHPGERYIFRAILQEEFALWILTSIGLAHNPLSQIIGLLFLLLSFWAIYERGYIDNDVVAARYELDPKLTSTFSAEWERNTRVQPWIWAALSGAAGVWTLRPSAATFPFYFASWMALLCLVYLCFVFYNRLNKQTRVWLYPFLQMGRTASFTIVSSIEPIGLAALSAHVFSRWLPYLIYRLTKSRDWPEARIGLVRLVSFILFSMLVAASLGPSAILTWCALGLLLWNVYRAKVDLYEVYASAHRIDLSADSKTEGAIDGSSRPSADQS
jgi:phosphoserine phosphatase